MSDSEHPFYRPTTPQDPLTQGDILDGVICIDAMSPVGKTRRVLVLSHSCEIDKPESQTFYVAVVKPVAKEGERFSGGIRAGNVRNLIYLPEHQALGGDAYADLRAICRVKFAAIGATLQDSQRRLGSPEQRLVGLDVFGVAVVQERVREFFCRTADPIVR